MKTVTNAFLVAQLQPDTRFVRVVEFKRRLWNDSTKVFDYESSWTVLPENEILKTNPITWKLDADLSNVFKVSNVSLDVLNFDNKWDTENDDGIFGVDAGSPSFKYERYLMKFRIRSGFKLPDGTNEIVTIFSGVAVEYVRNSTSRTCQIQLNGLEKTLFNTKAENIANFVVAESVGTGNGSNKDFTTTNPGVGEITKVTLDGTVQVLGDDYTISDTNESSLNGKITFSTAPANSVAVAADYYYWDLNQTFRATVEALLTVGGVSSENQLVEDIIFPNDVLNTVVINSEADFNAGTLTDVVTGEHPGVVEIDWEVAALRSSKPTWHSSSDGWTEYPGNGGFIQFTASEILLAAAGASPGGSPDGASQIRKRVIHTHGHFSFKYKFDGTDADNVFTFALGFNALAFVGFDVPINNISIRISPSTIFMDYPGSSNVAFASGTTYHTIDIFSTGKGFEFKVDGVTKFTDNTLHMVNQVSMYIKFEAPLFAGIGRLKDFSVPVDENATAKWESAIIDVGSTPSGWGSFTVVEEKEGYTNALKYYTRTSTDDISYDAWVLVIGTIVGSALKRYAQIKIEFEFPTDHDNLNIYGDPHVDRIDFRYTTSSTDIVLPEFTGLNVYEAIIKLAIFANYEVGYGPDEVFFFRSRTTIASVLSLDETDYISKISALKPGDDKVFGSVRVVYGNQIAEVIDDGLTPGGPVARVLDKRKIISPDSGIQILPGANVATGMAAQFSEYFFTPKRSFRMITRFLPQLDLTDIVQVSFKYGEPDTVPIMISVNCKIIGAKYDTTKHFCEFELEEVLP